jgi:hypothetical protein
MGLHWFRAPKIVVEVKGGEILVTMPGTSLTVVYEKPDDDQLIANSFSARKTINASSAFQSFLPSHGSPPKCGKLHVTREDV